MDFSVVIEIGSFLCQEGFPPGQQALGRVLLICCRIVDLAVEIERASAPGQGQEKEFLEKILPLVRLAARH